MQVEIKRFQSPDIEDLSNYAPQEADNFSFLLEVLIGIQGKEGEESFNFEICTPKWLLNNFKKNDIIIGKNYIIVFEYNFKKLSQTIKELIDNCTGNSWDEIANKICRFSHWEFENYYEILGD